MKKHISFILFFLLLILPDISLAGEGKKTKKIKTISLDFILREVLANNPTLSSFQDKLFAFNQVPGQVGALDDPELAFTIINLPSNSFSFTSENMTQKQISLTQKFPFPGKLYLKKKIAQDNTHVASKEYEDLLLMTRKEVKSLYYNLAFFHTVTDITKKNKQRIQEFVQIAETKYAVGKGLQQDVLFAQVELSRMIEKLIELKQKRGSFAAQLNMLMNKPVNESLGRPEKTEKTLLTYTLEDLQKRSLKKSPALQKILKEIEKNQTAVKLAKKEYYPDFGARISYGQRESSLQGKRSDLISAGISIKLPVWFTRKQKKKAAEAAYHLSMVKKQYTAKKNTIAFTIKDLLEKEEKSSKLISLFTTGIIPQATQSLHSALAGYRVNKVDFLPLLNNQITLFRYEIEYHRALTSHETVLAELEYIVGEKLF